MIYVRYLSMLAFPWLISAFLVNNRANNLWKEFVSSSVLHAEIGDRGINPKVLGTAFILSVGIFGSGFFASIGSQLNELKKSSQAQQESKLKNSNSNRGSLTSLTKKEINTKLQAIPVFFVEADDNDSKGVFISDNKGYFFIDYENARSYCNQFKGLKVSATSLDDVYFTLIEKKIKLKVTDGISKISDKSASYQLQPSKIPLYRIPNLVFNKEEGIEFPLFFLKDDALSSYERLAEFKRSDTPTIQETSLQDIINLFQGGGFEMRSLEFYPSINSIQKAKTLMGL